MKLFDVFLIRLLFVVESFEFGFERVLYTPPRFEKKRQYVKARSDYRKIAKKKLIRKAYASRGTRGK